MGVLLVKNAPKDPRLGKEFPPFGSMPIVSTVGNGVTRVIAPNASHMTLDGTNTYLVTDLRAGAAIIIDPGPISDSHFDNVKAALQSLDVEPAMILLTHHHIDHSEAAKGWSHALRVGVSAKRPDLVQGNGKLLAHGDNVNIGVSKLRVLDTPGHVEDHVSFISDSGYLFTGDHILGRSTSVISYPDGSLRQYLDSLEKIREVDRKAILPGHGPVMGGNLSTEVLEYYIAHRKWRISQVIETIRESPLIDVRQLTKIIYSKEITESLLPAAMQSTSATVRYLIDENIISTDDQDRLALIG